MLVVAVVTAVFGLVIGSFLNVVIYRLPRGQSLWYPGSRCPQCSKAIQWYDNIPLLSFLLLRGRCRSCGEVISWRYAVVEVLCAALFVLVLVRTVPLRWTLASVSELAGGLLFVSVLVCIAFIDLEHQLIPNSLSYGLLGAGLFLGLMKGTVIGSLLGAGLGASLFIAIALLSIVLLR